MSNRKYCSTSNEAYQSLKAEDIRAIYQKIIGALKVLGMAHTEAIATHLTMEHSKIHKRVSEMAALGIIWKTGAKLPMKSGRSAYLWQLTDAASPKTDNEVKYTKGTTNAADHAKKILELTSTQQQLF